MASDPESDARTTPFKKKATEGLPSLVAIDSTPTVKKEFVMFIIPQPKSPVQPNRYITSVINRRLPAVASVRTMPVVRVSR